MLIEVDSDGAFAAHRSLMVEFIEVNSNVGE